MTLDDFFQLKRASDAFADWVARDERQDDAPVSARHVPAGMTGWQDLDRHGDWVSEVLVGSDPKPHAERFPVAAPAAGGIAPPVAGLDAVQPPSPEDIPNNHWAYAVQWFLFAGIAAVIYAMAVARRVRTRPD